MRTSSLLRLAEHRALSALSLSGKVLDLGGHRHSEYRGLIKGAHETTIVNLDSGAEPDVVHDLEKPLPFPNASYDHVLLINVLEHIFDYRQLLAEAARVVKPRGKIVIVVPFFFPLHPSPNDYWRFGEAALKKECEAVHLKIESLISLGSGVFAARYVALDRLLPGVIRLVSFYTLRYVAGMLDTLFVATARLLRKKYDPADYALGYTLVATRS